MPDGCYYYDYESLVEIMKTSGVTYDFDLVDKAYKVALEAHNDQRRRSGIPYILHPVSVAYILVGLGMDSESIAAALLHDVVEDTDVTLQEIQKMFGKDVAALIDGVTKIGKIPFSSREEQQAENIRKMLIAMAKDIRVIIIKLADRLHNMRTIECMPDQKRRDKALENMEVYAPIAHRLGIRAIKEELEDISIRYLDPVAYQEIEKILNLRKSDRELFIEKTKQYIKEKLEGFIPNFHLEGRVKSINGIYRKIFVQGKSIEEIYDIYAVRVIVDTVNDCYNVLGLIHDIFTPLPNRFKDYISTPKPNLYQSLHTTVVGKDAIPFEVQIRTWEMHHTAEYGIAAHWKYKLGIAKKDSMEERLMWIRKMIEDQKDNEDATDLLRNIKSDLVPEEVYVFTPKGDVKVLPLGATVIDFAYAIHSAVGNRMVGAKVDKKIVPIDHEVKTGEIIEILTTKDLSRGPSRDWLKIVKTSEARNKIRQWFKKEKREENIIEGKLELEKEFRHNNIVIPEKELKDFLLKVIRKQKFNTLDDIYAAIGYGGIQIGRILPRIKEEYLKINKTPSPNQSENESITKPKEEPVIRTTKKKAVSGIIIEGVDNCLIKLSKCCNPLPSDEIIGFITRGNGVSIHKKNCINVPADIKNCDQPERWVNAYWQGDVKEEFQTTIEIIALDRPGLLADVTLQLYAMHIFIHKLNSKEDKEGNAIIRANVTVSSVEHLNVIISRLSHINKVTSVKRV